MQMLMYKPWVFVGAVLLFGGCYGQVAPFYQAQSDLTSGSLVVAGSIGILSFAAIAALAAMTGLQNTRIRNMPKEPDMTCEDNLAEEKEKCEAEKKDIRDGERAALEIFRKTIRGTCKEWVPFAEADCITCLEYFDDEMACSSDDTCIFADGVCLFDTSKIDG